ncbi:MAG: DeoR/GlpR transcriptional regulator [Ruminococcaceae bacterium]|nr:DeoR/GlpR transcriptional regulator [Oscillospiraceae bacterium]
MEERQRDILKKLYEKGRVSVAELAQTLYVSEMTVRRDLAEMEKGGYLRRYRGGAVLKQSDGEMPVSERYFMNREEKQALAQQASAFLSDGITVFLDSSSTCGYLLPYLARYKNVTLVTNSVKTLLAAAENHIPTILIGGEYYEQDMCLVGSLAEESVRALNVDLAFFTTAAYDGESGVVSDFDLRQTAIRKLILKSAAKSIFLFESYKLGKRMLYTLCEKKDAFAVLTTKGEGERNVL